MPLADHSTPGLLTVSPGLLTVSSLPRFGSTPAGKAAGVVLYTVYSILYTVYFILYTVYCILYTVYCKWKEINNEVRKRLFWGGDVCVCVCVVIPFILDVRLVDAPPAGVTQEECHTGFIHLPFAVLALLFTPRRI